MAAEAAASLFGAVSAAQAHNSVTAGECRAVTVGAQSASSYLLCVARLMTAAADERGWPSTDMAWKVLGQAMVTLDCRHEPVSTPDSDIGQAVILCQAGLRHELGPIPLAGQRFRTRQDLPQVLAHLQQIADLLPVMADQLLEIYRGWASSVRVHPTQDRLLGYIERARSESVTLAEALRSVTGEAPALDVRWA